MEKINVTLSNSGLPVLRESGGGMTNTGEATIIVLPTWRAPAPLFVPSRVLCYGPGAGYVVRPGMYVLTARRHHDDVTFLVLRIANANPHENQWGNTVVDAERVRPEIASWNIAEGMEGLPLAYRVAVERTLCYHCRCATHWPREQGE